MNLQAIKTLPLAILLPALLSACAPPPPQNFNALEFALRAPRPGSPTYSETIRYIDDGLRYVDPTSAFFVSPDGRMCFRGVLNDVQTIFAYGYDWCLSPMSVSRVEAVANGVGGVSQLVLWCKHSDPQCVREISPYHRTANLVTLPITPSDQEKVAVEHLIYLMGGGLGDSEPFARYSSASQYRGGPVELVRPPGP